MLPALLLCAAPPPPSLPRPGVASVRNPLLQPTQIPRASPSVPPLGRAPRQTGGPFSPPHNVGPPTVPSTTGGPPKGRGAFSKLVASNAASATPFKVPEGWYRAIRAYAAAHPEDGRLILAGLARNPRVHLGGWVLRLQPAAVAMTLGDDIFARSDGFGLVTFAHEMVHVGQYAKVGSSAFLSGYFGMATKEVARRLRAGEPLRVMDAAPYEREAYDVGKRFAAWLKAQRGGLAGDEGGLGESKEPADDRGYRFHVALMASLWSAVLGLSLGPAGGAAGAYLGAQVGLRRKREEGKPAAPEAPLDGRGEAVASTQLSGGVLWPSAPAWWLRELEGAQRSGHRVVAARLRLPRSIGRLGYGFVEEQWLKGPTRAVLAIDGTRVVLPGVRSLRAIAWDVARPRVPVGRRIVRVPRHRGLGDDEEATKDALPHHAAVARTLIAMAGGATLGSKLGPVGAFTGGLLGWVALHDTGPRKTTAGNNTAHPVRHCKGF